MKKELEIEVGLQINFLNFLSLIECKKTLMIRVKKDSYLYAYYISIISATGCVCMSNSWN